MSSAGSTGFGTRARISNAKLPRYSCAASASGTTSGSTRASAAAQVYRQSLQSPGLPQTKAFATVSYSSVVPRPQQPPASRGLCATP